MKHSFQIIESRDKNKRGALAVRVVDRQRGERLGNADVVLPDKLAEKVREALDFAVGEAKRNAIEAKRAELAELEGEDS